MPVDLEEMFHALRADADALPLNPAKQVRRLGRRLRMVRVAGAFVVTCAVIVGVVTVLGGPFGQQRATVGDDAGPTIEARLVLDAPGLQALTYSPDGRLLATAANDGNVRLRDAQTGDLTMTLTPPAGGVAIQVAFSSDGRKLAASDATGKIRVWDLATGQSFRTLAADRSGPVTDVAFSPDGTTLFAASEDGPVRLWSIADGQATTITAPNVRIIRLALSPDGRYVVAGGQRVNQQGRQNTIGIWDTATRASAQNLATHTNPVLSVAFSPDGRTFAAGGDDGRVRLWDMGSPSPRAEIVTLTGSGWHAVSDLDFSPDGRWLATAGYDQTAKLWDVATGDLVATFAGPTEGVSSVAFSPDGRTLAGSSGDGKLRFWDVL